MNTQEGYIWLLMKIDADFRNNNTMYDIENIEQNFERVFRVLSEDETTVLLHRYGLITGKEKSYREIGCIINKSISGAWRIERRAIKKIRTPYMKNMLLKGNMSCVDDRIMEKDIANIDFELNIYKCLLYNEVHYLKDISNLTYLDFARYHIDDAVISNFLNQLEHIGFTDNIWISSMRLRIEGI